MILITTPTVYYIFSCSKIRVQMILYLLKEHEDDIIDFWIKDFFKLCVFPGVGRRISVQGFQLPLDGNETWRDHSGGNKS